MRILVLHGPNLRLLGIREPELYGTMTLVQIDHAIAGEGKRLGAEVLCLQSNHEGELLDWLEEFRPLVDACLINAGGYTHTSVALLDAIKAFAKPTVEVHLTEPQSREEFRRTSIVGHGCVARFAGKGVESYLEGLRWVVAELRGR
ncbi:MAG TPA: type II 3-dehydroquinate dehydratase [bacterium]|nr:type II 3-dehydroquinate dehydratase [bacterium]